MLSVIYCYNFKVIAGVSEAILQYNRRDCAKLVDVLFNHLDFGGVDLCQATLDCIGRLMTTDCPNIVSSFPLHLLGQSAYSCFLCSSWI